MALETLKDVKKIGGFGVYELDENGVQIHPVDPNDTFITVSHGKHSIEFTLQKGPIKENGVNGCQVDSLIAAALRIITKLDENFPCDSNKSAMLHLANALSDLNDRKIDREARNVEGLNKK